MGIGSFGTDATEWLKGSPIDGTSGAPDWMKPFHSKKIAGQETEILQPLGEAIYGTDAKQQAQEQEDEQAKIDAQKAAVNASTATKLDEADRKRLEQAGIDAKSFLDSSYANTYEFTNALGKLLYGDDYNPATGLGSGGLSKAAKDSASRYDNEILPALKSLMDKRLANTEGALTLSEAQDPNNKVAASVRAFYDAQGDKANKQGLRDYGVLAGLGAQAAQGQFGATPITSGQMGQIYAANQRQAGDAYAKAQQRMYDLQQQGIDKGFDETKAWYDRGQLALQGAAESARDYTSGVNQADTSRRQYANDLSGLSQWIYGAKQNYADTNYNIANSLAGLGQATEYSINGRARGDSAEAQAMASAALQSAWGRQMAINASRDAMLAAGIKAAGSVAGAAI